MKKEELQRLKKEWEERRFEPIFRRRSPRITLDIEERIERAKKELEKSKRNSDYSLTFIDERLEYLIFSERLKTHLRNIIFSNEEENTQVWEGQFIQGEDFSYDWNVNGTPDRFSFLETSEEITSSNKIQVIEDEENRNSNRDCKEKKGVLDKNNKKELGVSKDNNFKNFSSHYSEDYGKRLNKRENYKKIPFITLMSISLVSLMINKKQRLLKILQ